MSELDEELQTGAPRRIPAAVWPVMIVAVVAAVAGYLVGAGRSTHRTVAGPTTTAIVTAAPTQGSSFSALLDLGADRCSLQSGHRLQLGVQLLNPGGAYARLQSITPEYPLRGLRTVSVRSGPCGLLQRADPIGIRVGTDELAWITVTVDVLVRCPRALPVQLDVRYTSAGREHDIRLPAFADLGDVTYSSCT